ncbi:hypothetical protein CSM97_000597 [Salmonella enterica subsp. diarizonae]|nr:hypothetical protein [Salmonella enterica subsp. diarizonae]ECI5275521.1 hypothetical protein [Salmonella enterica subsp. diarizonae]EDK8462837.1 hypothetical protein [Salmonella enterica subsp. diarizonae]EDX6218152.1 hypothetical protein [Salmonella enterica subsp. diarizonae]MDJ7597219.1 hypothetical protein [Salmonella enterica]
MSKKYIETHVIRYYHNGAHAGNIKLSVDVDSWGMNADEHSKVIKEEIIKMVSSRNYEHKKSYGLVSILTPHPLTAEQIKEWKDLPGAGGAVSNQIEKRIIDDKEVEIHKQISVERILTKMYFEINGIRQCSLKSTARAPAASGGRVKMELTPSVFEYLAMMKHHDRVHQAIVEDIRSSDALAVV